HRRGAPVLAPAAGPAHGGRRQGNRRARSLAARRAHHRAAVILVVATANPGKLREYESLLDGLGLELRAAAALAGAPRVDETADTYLDNARAKAHALARYSGCAALGDDSGLEVDALGGAPGVRSARFAADAGRAAAGDDAANRALLLERLRDTPDPERGARFRC